MAATSVEYSAATASTAQVSRQDAVVERCLRAKVVDRTAIALSFHSNEVAPVTKPPPEVGTSLIRYDAYRLAAQVDTTGRLDEYIKPSRLEVEKPLAAAT